MKYNPLSSTHVFQLESFKALCKDLGIDDEMPIEDLTITLNYEDIAKVNITFQAHKKED